MKLSTLLQRLTTADTFDDIEINGIQFDSRQVSEGDLFVAVRGTASDGHDFISMAIQRGAAAIVCETIPTDLVQMPSSAFPTLTVEMPDTEHVFVQVPDSAEALALVAAAWFGYPSERLTLVGVTGTNGKTTTATLLYEMFRHFGHKTGLLSTVRNYIDGAPLEATHTTPDPIELNRLLAAMLEAGCTHAFMEVSSHAIVQRRIAGLSFDGGIFTNITRDHIDYHETFENYLQAKKKFFDHLPKNAFALTNIDDRNGEVMLQNTCAARHSYSTRTLADFAGRIIEESFEGMLLRINGRDISVPFIGKFNVYNLLAVFGAAILLRKNEEDVLQAISALHPVCGRFEAMRAPQGYTAIVDYAHTPDALNNVLATINDIRRRRGRVITLVGCGGNRDKGKRPMMAREAALASDVVIITSDNPRHEDPQAIINDMLAGLTDEQRRRTHVIADRRQAIRTACNMAAAGDVVLIAGKGHEDYQIIGSEKHHFDDHEEVRLMFNV